MYSCIVKHLLSGLNPQPSDDCYLEAKGTNAYNRYATCPAGKFKSGWLVFYSISTFLGYLTPNPFLYK